MERLKVKPVKDNWIGVRVVKKVVDIGQMTTRMISVRSKNTVTKNKDSKGKLR